MSRPRRIPPPSTSAQGYFPQQQQGYYTAAPQTSPTRAPQYQSRPPVYARAPAPPQAPSRAPSARDRPSDIQTGRGQTAQGVATGAIGGGYGPYSYNPGNEREYSHTSRFSNTPSETSSSGDHSATSQNDATSTVPPYMWDIGDPDLDDALHNPDPIRDAALDHSYTIWSSRGWMNVGVLVILMGSLLALFAGYPIVAYSHHTTFHPPGFNIGGVNSSGQIPVLRGMPAVIDSDTPSSVQTRVGTDGKTYNLVFSDEFNVEGRTFWPGDDPYWEAQDIHYWPTGDLEWYDPQAIVTENGKLVITLSEVNNHNLSFQSGMLTSWNKMCFTTGYVEVSVSLPGSPQAPGLWPAIWTMGNLGKAGYGATTEGMWPYSYAACDVGTFPNQTYANATPTAADGLSFLPGQRLSACTCPGSDHPGPNVETGRGVPEIDVLEAQVDERNFTGEVSQSLQVAPYNYDYLFNNSPSATTIYNTSLTDFNVYKGGLYQQAVSAVTSVNGENYNNSGYATYGFEWWSDPNDRDAGYVTWFSQGQKSWTVTAATVGPDSATKISQRLISEEPHYLILNLGMSPSFQAQDYMHLQFPSKMYIDYIRVYQREDANNFGCDPSDRPTADYINNHMNAYTNPNLTTWAQANYTFPRNTFYDGCS